MKKISNSTIIIGIVLVLGLGFYLLAANGFLPKNNIQPLAENKMLEPKPENKPVVIPEAEKKPMPAVEEPVDKVEEAPLITLPLPMPVDPLQSLVNSKFNAYFALAKKSGGTVSNYTEAGSIYYKYGYEEADSHNKTEEIKDKKCFRYIGGEASGQQAGIWYNMYLNDFGGGEATTYGSYQMVDIKNKIVCDILHMDKTADWARGYERTSGEYICCGYYHLSNPDVMRDLKTMQIIKP